MKIMIDATPAELAELLFILTDNCADEDDDEGNEEIDDDEINLDKVGALNAIANILDLYAKTTTT